MNEIKDILLVSKIPMNSTKIEDQERKKQAIERYLFTFNLYYYLTSTATDDTT